MRDTRPVLVGLNFTDGSDEALRQASTYCKSSGTTLVVAHVLPEAFLVRVLFPQEAGVDGQAQAQVEVSARAAVKARDSGF